MVSLGKGTSFSQLERQLDKNGEKQGSIAARLSTGLRIFNVGDEPGTQLIAASYRSKAGTAEVGITNIKESSRAVSVADSALAALDAVTTQILSVANTASENTATQAQRNALDDEAQRLVTEYSRIAGSATYNNRQLLDGTFRVSSVTTGTTAAVSEPDISIGTVYSSGTTIPSVDLSTKDSASQAVTDYTTVANRVTNQVARVDGIQGNLDAATNQLSLSSATYLRASDNLINSNQADELARSLHSRITTQIGPALAAQANQSLQRVLTLVDDTFKNKA